MTTLEIIVLIIACCEVVSTMIGLVQTWLQEKATSMADAIASAGKQIALRDETIQHLNREYRKLNSMYQELVKEFEKLEASKYKAEKQK